jgi:nucleotide-binding universal stress UspA family protein
MIPKIKKILYATDLSKNSAYAFRYAINSAKHHNAEIAILHVIEVMDTTTRNLMSAYVDFTKKEKEKAAYAKDRIEKRLNLFFEKVRVEDSELIKINISTEICEGYPAEEILRKADELSCDAIVMGTHGKGLLSRTFLGSVAKKILRRTRKPVFIIPLPEEESDLTFHDI